MGLGRKGNREKARINSWNLSKYMAYLGYIKYFRVAGELSVWGRAAGNKSNRLSNVRLLFSMETISCLYHTPQSPGLLPHHALAS